MIGGTDFQGHVPQKENFTREEVIQILRQGLIDGPHRPQIEQQMCGLQDSTDRIFNEQFNKYIEQVL
jgi:hypothetical protein